MLAPVLGGASKTDKLPANVFEWKEVKRREEHEYYLFFLCSPIRESLFMIRSSVEYTYHWIMNAFGYLGSNFSLQLTLCWIFSKIFHPPGSQCPRV